MSRSYLYVLVLFYRLKCSQIHKNGPQDSNVSATSSLDQLSELNKKVINGTSMYYEHTRMSNV